jgi:hypothetical protein
VIPVSEQQTAAAAIGLAMQEFADHRSRVRDLVHLHAGDGDQRVRAVLQAEVFALDLLEERMLSHLRQRPAEEVPAGVPHRPVGEDTQAWRTGQAYMPRNRGPV